MVDVSDLEHPQAVATFGLAGSGTHNFWVDEPAQVLYAAYYNGGVVAIDVSGTLSGDLGRQAHLGGAARRAGQHLYVGRPGRQRIGVRQ